MANIVNQYGQVKVGVRVQSSGGGGGGGIDADAQAFITAASITDSTQQSAINTLVTQLKGYGIWTKMKALYPFVGGTATSHKFNLKDPRDLDAAFRLVFYGGMTHTNLGMVSNYTTSYASTNLTPSTALSSFYSQHVSVYSQTSTATPANNINSIGEWQDGTRAMVMKVRNLSNVFSWEVGNSGVSVTNNDGRGFYLGSTIANNSIKLYKDNTNVATNTSTFSGSLPSQVQPIGKNENKTFSFASIGDGLSDAEASAFYTAVQKYQTTLGRQVGVPIVADTDAQAFLNAAVITDSTQASAINTLVTDLKSANIWTKMKALYPFVGGSASSHKFNLKDPRDLDVAFRLSFSGGWTHSSTGALPNGTNAWANTYFSEYSHITNGDTQLSNYSHLSLYSRTNASSINTYGGVGVYDYQDYGTSFVLTLKRADGLSYAYSKNVNTTPVSMPDSRGFFILNRQSNSLFKYNRNDVLLAQNTTTTGAGGTRNAVNLGSAYDWGSRYYDNKEHAFVSIGFSLTDAESTALYNAVQKYQTSLGRQV